MKANKTYKKDNNILNEILALYEKTDNFSGAIAQSFYDLIKEHKEILKQKQNKNFKN